MTDKPIAPSEYSPDKFAALYATANGEKLWCVLTQPHIIASMVTASDLGQPALKPIEDVLLEEFGNAMMNDRMKQMAGHMVRQIMEANGFEHDTDGIRLASVPFYKASRYRRADGNTLFVFRDSAHPREFALTADRKGERLPSPPSGKRWSFYNTLTSPLKAHVGYGIRLEDANKAIAEKGYVRVRQERMLRAANAG